MATPALVYSEALETALGRIVRDMQAQAEVVAARGEAIIAGLLQRVAEAEARQRSLEDELRAMAAERMAAAEADQLARVTARLAEVRDGRDVDPAVIEGLSADVNERLLGVVGDMIEFADEFRTAISNHATRIDAETERIDAVEELLPSLARGADVVASVAALRTETVSEANAILVPLRERVGELAADVAEAVTGGERCCRNLDAFAADIVARVDGIEALIPTLARGDEVVAAIDKAEALIAEVDEQAEVTRERFNGHVDTTAVRLAALEAVTAELSDGCARTETDLIERLATARGEVGAVIGELGIAISSLTGRLDEYAAEQAKGDQQLADAIGRTIGDVATVREAAATALGEFETEVVTRFGAVDSRIDEIAADAARGAVEAQERLRVLPTAEETEALLARSVAAARADLLEAVGERVAAAVEKIDREALRGPEGLLPVARAWIDEVHYPGAVVTHAGATWQAARVTGHPPAADDEAWICLMPPPVQPKGFTVRGTYDPEAQYDELDIVVLKGSSFVALRNDPGPCPGDGWNLWAYPGRKGDKGDKGETTIVAPPAEPGPVALRVDDEGRLTQTLSDGTELVADFYPLLARLAK